MEIPNKQYSSKVGCPEVENQDADELPVPAVPDTAGASTPGDPNHNDDDENDLDQIFKKIAQQLADRFNGTWGEADNGNGWKASFKLGRFNLDVRLMIEGGQRALPYLRITSSGKGALTAAGFWSNDRALTHLAPAADVFRQIISLLEQLLINYPKK